MTATTTMNEPQYYQLTIEAAPTTEIWLGDADGYLVQREIGRLTARLLPGRYVVQFGLGAPRREIALFADQGYTQQQLERRHFPASNDQKGA